MQAPVPWPTFTHEPISGLEPRGPPSLRHPPQGSRDRRVAGGAALDELIASTGVQVPRLVSCQQGSRPWLGLAQGRVNHASDEDLGSQRSG
jgi:hypothetical protein